MAKGKDGKSSGYLVGYGRPPVHSQFRPGQSGNPKGRPSKGHSIRAIINNILGERIPVRVNDKPRVMTRLEAILRTLANKAMSGDLKAMQLVIKLIDSLGIHQNKSPEDIERIRAGLIRKINRIIEVQEMEDFEKPTEIYEPPTEICDPPLNN